jgi:hypothetical protein
LIGSSSLNIRSGANPANGVRFKITLRDWQGALWAVRVHPQGKREPWYPFTRAHRLMAWDRIEDWLENLRLPRVVRCKKFLSVKFPRNRTRLSLGRVC